ncbi:WD40 repeat-like protein [Sodiomyces alkalinus F11]|uniref:WD40 repeat-like protein n=1 Tax=Sodiomyces alkalinus (strain CBS 110278 / VKM F-3762 / F11) TaxID=1314773 RepID=A0A3N2PW66_SODAK|nr:WD40 repeat-like protein [Sodiomyces alkalinus F11]ROT38734.1 WD40 repeat-like protein [Sodiomyces alkalinus F11]
MTSHAQLDPPDPPTTADDKAGFDLNLSHGHRDLVQAVAFNAYGDRCATGAVDGKIRVFNRHKEGIWRLCDSWTAHGGEIFELQWLPPTVYPNLLASLGVEGRFKLWCEDPSAAPGRRFSPSSRSTTPGKAAFETRSSKAPFRSFSLKHNDETRHTHLALLATDGHLVIYENDQPEMLSEWTLADEFPVCPKPPRGVELSFRVRFDPNPDPCYKALRAGAPADSLALVVAAMHTVKIYRSRDVITAPYGVPQAQREFYLAADLTSVAPHRGLVRDVAWAPGNVRGYDTVATACQDGCVRVFRVETPYDEEDGKTWASADIVKRDTQPATPEPPHPPHHSGTPPERHHLHHQQSGLSASLAKSGGVSGERQPSGQPGQIAHTVKEVAKLDSHHTPVWRVNFDDDGQILGSTGDDGKLLFYRQTPQGTWVKSSELAMQKTRMATPS